MENLLQGVEDPHQCAERSVGVLDYPLVELRDGHSVHLTDRVTSGDKSYPISRMLHVVDLLRLEWTIGVYSFHTHNWTMLEGFL